jgi:hypothetical protein
MAQVSRVAAYKCKALSLKPQYGGGGECGGGGEADTWTK